MLVHTISVSESDLLYIMGAVNSKMLSYIDSGNKEGEETFHNILIKLKTTEQNDLENFKHSE